MNFSLRELHGVPGLCPWNYSWPERLKTRSGAQSATRVTAQGQPLQWSVLISGEFAWFLILRRERCSIWQGCRQGVQRLSN